MLKITKFTASWCKPCEQLDKVMNEVLPSYDTGVLYAKVDVEENVDYAEKMQIRGVPTLIFENNGEIVCRLVGLRSGNEIKAIIDQYVK